nr:uncharacterized protein CTRU02_14238 [Colletotrichum truncatum]KAF6782461.1 hypothetical protein CTRU02_14238 [Colletotrichum truncatum]
MVAELWTRVVKNQISNLSTFAAQHKREEMAKAPSKKPDAGKKTSKEDPVHAAVEEIDPGHEYLEYLGWADVIEDDEEGWLDSWNSKGHLQTWLKTSLKNWRKTWLDGGKSPKEALEEPVTEHATAAETTEEQQDVSPSANEDASTPLPIAAGVPVAGSSRTQRPVPDIATYHPIKPPQMPTEPPLVTSGNTTVAHPASKSISETMRQPDALVYAPAETHQALGAPLSIMAEGFYANQPAFVPTSETVPSRSHPDSIFTVAQTQPASATFTPACTSPQPSPGSPLVPAGNTAVVARPDPIVTAKLTRLPDVVTLTPALVSQTATRQLPVTEGNITVPKTGLDSVLETLPLPIVVKSVSSEVAKAQPARLQHMQIQSQMLVSVGQSGRKPIDTTGTRDGQSAPQSEVASDPGHRLREGLAYSAVKMCYGIADSDLDHGVGQAQDSRALADSGREERVPSLSGARRQMFFKWYKDVYRTIKSPQQLKRILLTVKMPGTHVHTEFASGISYKVAITTAPPNRGFKT